MGALVREVIDARRVAVRAESVVLPSYRGEVVYRRLFVGKRVHHLDEGIEVLHGGFLAHAA